MIANTATAITTRPEQDSSAELQPLAPPRGGRFLALELKPLLAPCFLLLLTTCHEGGQASGGS